MGSQSLKIYIKQKDESVLVSYYDRMCIAILKIFSTPWKVYFMKHEMPALPQHAIRRSQTYISLTRTYGYGHMTPHHATDIISYFE